MVQVMPPDSVVAPVAEEVLATMAGQAVVLATDLEPVAVDTLEISSLGQARTRAHLFILLLNITQKCSSFVLFLLGSK